MTAAATTPTLLTLRVRAWPRAVSGAATQVEREGFQSVRNVLFMASENGADRCNSVANVIHLYQQML
jgi:hypothetical protein